MTNVIIVINKLYLFMRWKSKYTKANHQEGVTRLKRAFAWMPVYISGDMVWLETYEVLQVYVIKSQKAIIDDQEQNFTIGQWVDLSKRTCK